MSTDKYTDDGPTASYPTVDGAAAAAPLTTAAGDRCVSCGAPLASDQRYCVNCGERRGRARFDAAAMGRGASDNTETYTYTAPPRSGGFGSQTSSIMVVAFIAVLLVAVGLGILIGHDSSGSKTIAASTKPQAPVNVTVNGGGSGTSGTSGTSSSNTTSSSAPPTNKVPKTAKAKAAATAKAEKASQAAASKATGGSGDSASPTAHQGSSCKPGTSGCSANGKFTGTFFGGG